MSRKLCDRLQPEKSALLYADLPQKQRNNRRATQEDELVKYMSNLPGYLERGENIHEKVLNFGVLDWTRLEQWQYGNKHIPHRSSSSSSCTSNKSSVSIEGLSGPSSRGHSSSPSHHRKCRPSLQYHFMASPMQGQSTAGNPPEVSDGNCQSLGSSYSNFDVQSKLVRGDNHLCQNIPNARLKACNRECSDPNRDKESVVLPNDQNCEARSSCANLERSIQDGQLKERMETLQEPNMNTIKKSVLRKSKTVVLLPGDVPQNSHPGVPDNTALLGQKPVQPCRTNFSEKSKEPSLKDPKYDTSHSCSRPYGVNCNQSLAKGSSPMDDTSTKISSSAAVFSTLLAAKSGTTPSRSGKAEERKQTVASISSAIGLPLVSDQKVTSEKSRSSSPFRRFSISFGNTSKGSGFKEGVDTPHRRSVADAKSGSEIFRGSASSDISGKDTSGNAVRSRSSPLRRLLDPLLKPKAEDCPSSMESSQRDSMINKNCRLANKNFSTLQPEKELDRGQRVGCSKIVTDSSKKHVSSSVQALLRIVVKNGLPLFTFAVDNNNDILAATVKKLSTSRKDECSCVYTFFTFRELKKKNRSWINQASKAKGSDFIHEVVAQMKVSDSHYFDFTGQSCVDSSILKEFVLVSVKLRQGDDLATDYQPNDELAAIVVKIPKTINFFNDMDQSSCNNDSKGLVHATVVLPSGVHSLPSKGGPSSLIERWKTGGSCDCGGWDLGCKLKILANEYKECEQSRSSEANYAEQFELFFQGNGLERRLAVSFSLFKNGIYSVAFDPSLSLLQAFSICIALLDGRMPSEVYESRNLVEERTPGETESVHTDGIKAFSKSEDVPARFVSYPPISPVGRV